MSRKTTTVTLNDKAFVIRELTVDEIIQLVNESTLWGGRLNEGNGAGKEAKTNQKAQEQTGEKKAETGIKSALEELTLLATGLTTDMKKMMEKSCDFSITDLRPLAPSEIRQLVKAFEEMNNDFLELLKALGLKEVILEVREATLSSFSRTLVTSLRAAM